VRSDPAQEQEWLRQNNLIYGWLIGIGVVAGFWHIGWIAGVGVLVSGLVEIAVHAAGYVRLEAEEPGAPRP
jgi:hypothetical protein